MAAGIYSLTNLVVAAFGTLATSPFGSVDIPEKLLIDTRPNAPSGYSALVEGKDGRRVGTAMSSTPRHVDLNVIPDDLINAVVAIEDKRFLDHQGVDPVGILAAGLDAITGQIRGGSTIAQQTVKNALTGNEVSLRRKLSEAMVAIRLQSLAGRREVVRQYLQSAWIGRATTGIMPAAELWFAKDWDEISLAENAVLAGMLKGPGHYDPFRRPDVSRDRRDVVLKAMLARDWISQAEFDEAFATPVSASAREHRDPYGAWPWELRASVSYLSAIEGMPKDAVAITTIEPEWQKLSQAALSEQLSDFRIKPDRISEAERLALIGMGQAATMPEQSIIDLPAGSPYTTAILLSLEKGKWTALTESGLIEAPLQLLLDAGFDLRPGDIVPVLKEPLTETTPSLQVLLRPEIEGAVVVMDVKNGELLASIGGVDPGFSAFDRTRASRQPGSSIKPFLYLAALDKGYSPTTPLEDTEREWVTEDGARWTPRNFDLKQSGQIPLFSALERSSNLAAAYLMNMVGPEAMADIAESAGVYIPGKMKRILPAALGVSEVRLVDLVAGYAAIANNGMPRSPHIISHISGSDAEIIPDFRRAGPIAGRRALQDIRAMMRGVIKRGTASVAFSGSPVSIAGKTGTTQDYRDAWFVGFTPDIAIGVWVGRDDNGPLPGRMTGGTTAAPIAAVIIEQAFRNGLIDENGYRGQVTDPGYSWPPKLIVDQADPVFVEFGNQPGPGHFPGDETNGSGYFQFLGVISDERSRRADDDRNGDLIDMINGF